MDQDRARLVLTTLGVQPITSRYPDLQNLRHLLQLKKLKKPRKVMTETTIMATRRKHLASLITQIVKPVVLR